MYWIPTTAIFSVAYASVHDVAPDRMIGVLHKLVERGLKERYRSWGQGFSIHSAMELVDRSKASPKKKETATAIEAAQTGVPGDLSSLIADFAVGPRVDVLDLDEMFDNRILLIMAVLKQKRPNAIFLPLPFLSSICWQ